MAFTETFGGTTIYPSDVSYRAISLSANQTLAWPLEVATSGNVVAQIMDVTPSAGSFTITMPPANEASPGETALFFNAGSFNFTVADNAGNTIVAITPGLAYQVYLTTNTTVAGTWRTTQFGAGTSSATAGSLIGAGIKAINTTLNQSMAVTSLSVNYTAGAADRSAAFLWTGGAGTITLPAASTVGNDWFFHIRNGGTGAISLATTGGELINGTATVDFNPGDSAIIVCDGTGYFTIGFGQAPEFLFDYVSIDLTSQSSPYTLAGSNLNRIAYQFSGTLTTNMQIIVPATIQQYWVGNFTTGGSYTVTVKTSAGTGTVVPRDARSILYCNGTDVVNADTGGISIPILVSQGGTGATNASQARTNLGATSIGNALFIAVDEATARNAIIAAKSGANSDITSLTGLTTPLSVPQGGTGVATFTANGIVYGSGASALAVTVAGTTGQVLVGNTGTAPSWSTLSGIGVTSFSAGSTGLTPSTATTGIVTLAGTLIAANGGTGFASYAVGDLLFASTTTVLSKLADVATGNALISGGIGVAPSYGKIGLTTHISGTLDVGNGGTGATTLTGYVKGSGTSAFTASATIPATDISSGAALTKTDDTNVTLTLGGSPTTALLAATSITAGWTGQLSVSRGGTGQSSYTDGQLLIGNTTGNTLTKTTLTAGTNVTITNGSGAITINATDQYVGTVTSVSGTGTVSGLTLTGTVTTSGNLTLGGTLAVTASDFASQTAKTFLAAPNASAGVPSFRAIIPADVPTLNQNTTGTASNVTGTVAVGNGGTGATTLTSGYLLKGNGTSAVSASVVYDTGTNVGIGTTSPTAPFTVSAGSVMSRFQTGSAADGRIEFAYNTTDIGYMNMASATQLELYGRSGVALAFGAGGSERMRIDTSGRLFLNSTTGVGNEQMLVAFNSSGSVTQAVNMRDNNASGNGNSFIVLRRSDDTYLGAIGRSGTDSAMFVDGNSYLTLRTGGTERMRIDTSGNVIVGTTSALAKLHVAANATYQQYLTGTDINQQLRLGYDTTNEVGKIQSVKVGVGFKDLVLQPEGNNVGIGEPTPSSKLTVGANPPSAGAIAAVCAAAGTSLALSDNVNSSLYVRHPSGAPATIGTDAGGALAFASGTTERMRMDSSGNLGVGTSSPVGKIDYISGSARVYMSDQGSAGFITAVNTTNTAFAPLALNGSILILKTGDAERARIDASGDVGIGTSSPGYRLDVASGDTFANIGYAMRLRSNATATAAAIQFTDSTVSAQNGLIACTDAGALTIQSDGGSSNIKFRTNGAERASISSDGHFGMGTSTRLGTNETLSVSAISTFDGMWVKNLSAAAVTAVIWNAATSGDNSFISFATEAAATGRGSITYNRAGGLVAYNVTSDYRAKDIIGPVTDAGATIDALKVYNGKMKGATIERPMLIAHEAQEVVPYAVTGEKDAVNEDGTDKHQQMDHQSLIPLLIAEIQSLRARVAQLEGN